MRKFLFALPLLFCAAAPAHATAGMFCETSGAKPITVSLVISRVVGGPLIEATLTDGDAVIPTEKAQWWIDAGELRLILIDPNAEREEVEIRVRGRGEVMTGTLKRGGKTYRVRCEESG